MAFYIMNIVTDDPLERDGQTVLIEDGAEAAKLAQTLTEETGQKHQPRRHVTDTSWRANETRKFEDGLLSHLPWTQNEPFYSVSGRVRQRVENATQYNKFSSEYARQRYDSNYDVRDKAYQAFKNAQKECEEIYNKLTYYYHFATCGAYDEKLKSCPISFIKNDDMGMQGRRSLLSAEGYLKKYLAPILRGTELEQMLAVHNEACKPVEVLFARTKAEIKRVYVNYDKSIGNLQSCMRHSNWAMLKGSGLTHPTQVYAAGDLAIAYLKNSKGKTTARALCWPERKLYSRVYGADDKLHKGLRALGYSKSRYYGSQYGSLEGAKLLKVETKHKDADDKGRKIYVMPYLDEGVFARVEKDHLILDARGRTNTRCTNGLTNENIATVHICAHCGEDDGSHGVCFENPTGNLARSEIWCEDCCEHGAIIIDESASSSSGYWGCTYVPNTLPTIEVRDTRHYSHVWRQSFANRAATYCALDGVLTSNDLIVRAWDGARVFRYNLSAYNAAHPQPVQVEIPFLTIAE